jgi:hypothetical protein
VSIDQGASEPVRPSTEKATYKKNESRRLLDLDLSILDQLSHLLSHYYEHASITARPILSNTKDRWRTRGWRKEARQLLAGLLLSLANTETMP